MKNFAVVSLLLAAATAAFGGPCMPGTLQDYINLGAGGCTIGVVTFNNFATEPGQALATPVDPMLVSVTPGGSSLNPAFVVSSTLSAGPGQLFESLFRLNASSMLYGASISLNGASATGDGAVTGILDVCSGGMYAGPGPTGCTGTSDSAVAVVLDGFAMPMDSRSFPVSSFFDVFVDLSVDGGLSGGAAFTSATISLQAVPEPAIGWTVGSGLALFAVSRLRRKKSGGQS